VQKAEHDHAIGAISARELRDAKREVQRACRREGK
jgi:hypothetical protein